MAKFLVIGSNAFSGQDFVDLLLEDPENEVLGVSRSPENPDLMLRYKDRSDLSNFRFRQYDLNQGIETFFEFLDDEAPEFIVNFAAQSEVGPSWQYPDHWFQTNCVALARLVKHLSVQEYLQKFLHVSSPEVYGSCEGNVVEEAQMFPSTPYAASKAAADMLLKTFSDQTHFPLLTVRATNVYGARQQLFKIIMRACIYIRLGRRIQLHGGGEAAKSFIHVRDISKGELAILEHGRVGEIYHLSPDKSIKVRQVVSMIADCMGTTLEAVSEDIEDRLGQDAVYKIDSRKARMELDWKPETNLDQGIKEVVRWVELNWNRIEHLPHDYAHKP